MFNIKLQSTLCRRYATEVPWLGKRFNVFGCRERSCFMLKKNSMEIWRDYFGNIISITSNTIAKITSYCGIIRYEISYTAFGLYIKLGIISTSVLIDTTKLSHLKNVALFARLLYLPQPLIVFSLTMTNVLRNILY